MKPAKFNKGSIESFLVDSSRAVADITAQYVGNDAGRYHKVFKLVQLDLYPISMRAARVLYLATINYPYLFRNYLKESVALIKTAKVDGVKRSLMAILIERNYKIEEDEWGILIGTCFDFFQDTNVAIAIRALAISILLKSTKVYPGLKQELAMVIGEQIQHASVGLKGRCKAVLRALEK